MTSRLIPTYPPGDTRRGASGELVPIGLSGTIIQAIRPSVILRTGQAHNIGSAQPQQVVGASDYRRAVVLKNEGTVDVYLGDQSVTVGLGFRLGVGQSVTLETGAAISGITPSGSGVVHWLAEEDAAS